MSLNLGGNERQRFAVAHTQASPLSSNHFHLPLVAFRRFQQCRVFAVATGAARGLVTLAVVAVRLGPAATGSTALHLHIFLCGWAGAVVLGRRWGILPAAAVAALWLEAEVGPALAKAAHAMQLRHGAAPGRSPRQRATLSRRSAPWGFPFIQDCEEILLGVWIFWHEEMRCLACSRRVNKMKWHN